MNDTACSRQQGNLAKVLEISRAMMATVDLDALLKLIIDRGMELLSAERATLFLYDAQHNELVSRIAAGAREIRIPADRGIAGAAVKLGQTINVADAYADERFNREVDRQTGFRTRNILAVPLRDYEGQLVGVLQVLNKRQGGFTAVDVELAETLAAQAGVVIQRDQLIEHLMEKQQMERAMKLAREIQQGLLPQGPPSICGFDVAGFCQPADATGGDTYDFMPLGDGRWMLTVADATGHGIGPALVIAETRAILRAVSLHSCDVSHVLRTVNRLLTADLGESRFVTCFLAQLDPLSRLLSYASAGHGPMLFYSRREDRFQQVSATDLPLGMIDEVEYGEVIHLEMAPGDLAVVTTDGFFEASDAEGNPFGIERMESLLRTWRDLPAEQMIRNLTEQVLAFTRGQRQADDLTAVVVKSRIR